ncbi:hypothetical protein HYW32_02760 [Candidatus Berkelbacteria bacterium]|nr:hypothetical protein [Candidatus Berkelbacteria bacterium]
MEKNAEEDQMVKEYEVLGFAEAEIRRYLQIVVAYEEAKCWLAQARELVENAGATLPGIPACLKPDKDGLLRILREVVVFLESGGQSTIGLEELMAPYIQGLTNYKAQLENGRFVESLRQRYFDEDPSGSSE